MQYVDTALGNLEFSMNMTDLFTSSPNPVHKALASRYTPYPTYPQGIDMAKSGEVVMIESRTLLEYLIRSQVQFSCR